MRILHLHLHFPTDCEWPQPQFGLFLIPDHSSLSAKLDTMRGLAPNFEPAISPDPDEGRLSQPSLALK
jgi:hypothetical protein